jgi:hypothetical protein
MGESSRHLAAQLRLRPVGVFLTNSSGDKFARDPEHLISDLQPLSARLGAEDGGHVVVDHFNISRVKRSGRLRHR